MNKSNVTRVAIATIAVAIVVGGAALRRRSRVDSDPPGGGQERPVVVAQVPEGGGGPDLALIPVEPVRSESPQAQPGAEMSPELWREVQDMVAALTGDEGRRREFLKAFLKMVGRVRDIEKALVRYRVDAEKTVIEIPGFREEGRAIYAEWRKACLAVLTPEEEARFIATPEFETGRLSPELDLLRATNLFTGGRHGKQMEPDFFWDDTTRIDALRLPGGRVQIRVATPENTASSEFESQQAALNHVIRGYGHLLGPIPQLFR